MSDEALGPAGEAKEPAEARRDRPSSTSVEPPDPTRTTEVPVSRVARDRYAFDEPLHPPADPADPPARAAGRLARRMSERWTPGSAAVPRPGQLRAMTVIHEAMHRVIDGQRDRGGAPIFGEALVALSRDVGTGVLDEALRAHAAEFPVAAVFRGDDEVEGFLAGQTGQRPHREMVLEELLLLWITNRNPAFVRHGELFDEYPVARASPYTEVIEGLRRNLADVTVIADEGPGRDLVSLLLEPARAAPESLAEQLRLIRRSWPGVADLVDETQLDLDRLAAVERGEADGDEDDEAANAFATPVTGMGGPGPADASALHGFSGLEEESERYSEDREWMPRLVLIAKSTYVWLDQLSRSYGRAIRTLDAIPDEELDRLAAQGLSGLWLIGVWERSHASQRIKQMRGNPEAVASAYSLMDYRISGDLGGEEAFAALRDRAWARGIRLACDMVPNHMGIDSRWVVDHPERFVSRADSPYPAYSFDGPNLSSDERVGIYLEDHYYDATDAAVVFRRVDRWSGEERYLFHGNDGTGMPWNDTAQLDYLRADVREAVIQTILAVARRAPVIRFDAAMTLARRHVQRLWYPAPHTGESIPSRSDAALDPEEFARQMPEEFWREVVDRVAEEAPDTLLLAEAFWLMEGYFVRTLGMHRVYNSAFMHMLRDEDNAGYRTVMRNTLAFDPEILKRYVNFMSNPDERSARDQFGEGDKYFGVATVMATLPGLPMFGHGQVEGFAERYGMEFRRARLDEQADLHLIERHEREIFPLLHLRALFADATDFLLFDVLTKDGSVADDVYAYCNRAGDRRALVLFHNRYAEVRGRIRDAIPGSVVVDGGERALRSRSIADGLGLPADEDGWLILRDMRSGREWLRQCATIRAEGLDVHLGAYESRVFLDPQVVHDGPRREYARLAARLHGEPVPSVHDAVDAMVREPAREAIASLLDGEAFRRIAGGALGRDPKAAGRMLDQEATRSVDGLARLAAAAGTPEEAGREAAGILEERLRQITRLVRESRTVGAPSPDGAPSADSPLSPDGAAGADRAASTDGVAGPTGTWLGTDRMRWLVLLGWAYLDAVRAALDIDEADAAWMSAWDVRPLLSDVARTLGLQDPAARRGCALAEALAAIPRAALGGADARDRAGQVPDAGGASDAFEDPAADRRGPARAAALPGVWLSHGSVRDALGANEWQGDTFVEREGLNDLVDALVARSAVAVAADEDQGLSEEHAAGERLKASAAAAGWRVRVDDGQGRGR